jgi:hypothetical protein
MTKIWEATELKTAAEWRGIALLEAAEHRNESRSSDLY